MSLQICRVNRVVRTLCSGSSSSSSSTNFPVSCNLVTGLSAPLQRQPHQRRHSSSKTPISPAAAPAASPQHDTAGGTPAKTSPNRATRRRAKNSSAVTLKDKDDVPVRLPIVPPTNHLYQHDVGVSNFYSQHRPISLTMSTPPQSSPNAFDKLFVKKSNPKTADVIETLSNAVQSYEDRVKEANVVRLEIRESPVDQHRQMDSAGMQQEFRPMTLEEYVARFKPYSPPPPPEPMPGPERRTKRKSASRSRRSEVESTEPAPRQTSYKTTILVTESVHANGQKTYTASTSPLEEVPSPTTAQVTEPVGTRLERNQQPFLDRMRIRQRRLNEYRQERNRGSKGKMLLISVKRQRKLKMKKHKYKKLMKRTRNLRRRLDRN